MPNDVTHKLIFAEEKSTEIFAECCPEGKFDFNTLVPQPPNLYQGCISSDDERDFPHNWSSWNIDNWGTKWNAYNQICGVENGKAFIMFDTAYSIPYPVIAAFANKFGIPFEHRYFNEGHKFWGIELWAVEDGLVRRVNKRKSIYDDKSALCLELQGYAIMRDEERLK